MKDTYTFFIVYATKLIVVFFYLFRFNKYLSIIYVYYFGGIKTYL